MLNLGEIGVLLRLTGNVSSVVQGWIKQFYALNVAAVASQRALTAIKLSAGGIVLGGAIIADMLHLTKLGEKYISQLREMENKNLSPAQIAEAESTARRVASAVPQTTLTGNLKDWQDLLQVFGDPKHATEYLELTEKASMMMSAGMQAAGHSAEGAKDEVFKMARALEDAGAAMDPVRFAKDLNEMLKVAQATNYRITGQDFLMMIQQSKTAALSYSDEYMTRYLPIAAQGIGASKAGTAGMTFYAEMVGGVMKEKTAQYMMSLGLLDPTKVVRNRMGSIKGVLPGGVMGADLAATNPYEWVQTVLLPALKSHGITDEKRIKEAIASIVPVRTAQDLITLYATQQQRFEKDKAMIDAANGLSRYAEASQSNPIMVRAAAEAQWNRVETDLGKAISPMVTAQIYKLSVALKSLAEILERHPNGAKLLMEIAAGLGILLVVVGTAAAVATILGILAAALNPVGLAVIGVIAAIAAFGIIWHYIDDLKYAWQVVCDTIAGWWKWLAQVVPPALTNAWNVVERTFENCWNWLSTTAVGLINSAWSAVTNAITAQIDRITGALAGIGNAIRAFVDRMLALIPSLPGGGLTPQTGPPGVGPSLPNLAPHGLPGLDTRPLSPLHPSGFQMPAPPSNPMRTAMTQVNLVLDGRKVSDIVLGHFSDGVTRQLGGTAGSDDRLTPRPFGASISL